MLALVNGVHFENGVEVPPHRNNQHLSSQERAYNHRTVFVDNVLTTPKGCHDATTPTKNLAGFNDY